MVPTSPSSRNCSETSSFFSRFSKVSFPSHVLCFANALSLCLSWSVLLRRVAISVWSCSIRICSWSRSFHTSLVSWRLTLSEFSSCWNKLLRERKLIFQNTALNMSSASSVFSAYSALLLSMKILSLGTPVLLKTSCRACFWLSANVRSIKMFLDMSFPNIDIMESKMYSCSMLGRAKEAWVTKPTPSRWSTPIGGVAERNSLIWSATVLSISSPLESP